MLKLIARLYAVVVVGLSSQAWSFDLVMDASSIGTLPAEEIEVVGKRPVRWNTWPVVWLSNGGYQVGGGGFQPMSWNQKSCTQCSVDFYYARLSCDRERTSTVCASSNNYNGYNDVYRCLDAAHRQQLICYATAEGNFKECSKDCRP